MEIRRDFEHGIVNRTQNSIFSYQGWPSVCRDENGTLYAVASSFRTSHICPFGKTAMYVSRDNGKSWTPPIVINDTYLDDRDAGIVYLGNGKLLLTWFSHPAEVYASGRYFGAIRNAPSPIEAGAVLGMLGGYPYIPKELARGGSFIRISNDYGVTWERLSAYRCRHRTDLGYCATVGSSTSARKCMPKMKCRKARSVRWKAVTVAIAGSCSASSICRRGFRVTTSTNRTSLNCLTDGFSARSARRTRVFRTASRYTLPYHVTAARLGAISNAPTSAVPLPPAASFVGRAHLRVRTARSSVR